jgi:anaerobic magnesium-protoporphyrin IX monomethyl ester cyclase
MERVLLINPGQTYFGQTFRQSARGSIGLPLGLLYVAAAFEKNGCEVRVVDSLVSPATEMTKRNGRVHYGIPPAKLAPIIREFRPDIVGISNPFTAQEEDALHTAQLVKSLDAAILVIVGGANASCRAHELLNSGHVDIAVKPEGERIVGEILEHVRGGKDLAQIQGIAFHRNGGIRDTGEYRPPKNLDDIPWPAYHLVDMERYLTLYRQGIATRDRDVVRNMSMITSRGCPYGCIFCSISLSMGKTWRAHPTEDVIRHIRMLAETYRVRHIHFEDDNLLFDPQRFLPVLDVLSQNAITWDTPNGIRVDLSLDETILKNMVRSGCKALTIGVESGDERVLQQIVRKRINLADVEEFARRCRKVRLPLRAFFILGFPGETKQTMRRTMDFALHLLRDYDVEIVNLIATPLFGTDLYRLCSQKQYFAEEITPRGLSESTVSDGRCLIRTESFSSRDVERMSRAFTAKVYRRLFLKGLSHPHKSLKRIGNPYILLRTLKRIWPGMPVMSRTRPRV